MDHADNWFLGALADADLSRLRPHLSEVRITRGQVLCEAGQPVENLWFFRVGMCSEVHLLEDGFEVEVCAFGYESAFGLVAATGPSTSLVRDLRQVGGEGWRLPAPVFTEACARSVPLSQLVVRHAQAAIGFMARSLACNTHHSLEARLSRWLLTAADYAVGHRLEITHEFLAIMLGSTRSSVTLGLGELQRQGLISVARGEIVLTDRNGLMRRSCECYAATRNAWSKLRPVAAPVAAGV